MRRSYPVWRSAHPTEGCPDWKSGPELEPHVYSGLKKFLGLPEPHSRSKCPDTKLAPCLPEAFPPISFFLACPKEVAPNSRGSPESPEQ